MSKRSKKIKDKKINKDAPTLLLLAGAFFVLISAAHWHLKYQALSLDKQLLEQYSEAKQIDTSGMIPTHIFIQWFIDTSITEQLFNNENWTISDTEASYLSQSAKPGEKGNIIIYGHNKRSIMGNIRALKGNEIIILTTKDGSIHQYKIEKLIEVNPDQTEYLEPTQEETLTLYTCSGFLDSKRFIVQAKPIITPVEKTEDTSQLDQ